MNKTTTLLAVLALVTPACAHQLEPVAVRERHLPPHAAVTVVRVNPPWYAVRPLIKRGLRKAVPQYQAVSGLERKDFTIAQDGAFGGVYLWSDEATAREWFGPAWHDRVNAKYGHDGDVRFFEASTILEGANAAVEEGAMVATLTPGTLTSYAGAGGLRSAIAVHSGDRELVMATWYAREPAEQFLTGTPGVEWFDVPVAITNVSPERTR